MALSGKKWEIIYGTDNMHFHNCLEIGYCHYGNGTICVAEKELLYHAGTITFIPKNTPHRTCPTPEERGKKQKWGKVILWCITQIIASHICLNLAT